MWKFWNLVLGIYFLLSENCFAMQFSQPIEIGKIFTPTGGVKMVNASYNKGSYWREFDKNNTKSYEKGIARFDKGQEAIYVHYDLYGAFYFGGEDKNNTIEDNFLSYDIYKINTNEGIIIYPLYKSYGPEANYLIIGKRADGRFVKYIDTNELSQRYFGWNGKSISPIIYPKLYTQNDILVIEYQRYGNKQLIKGKFYFKWDDNAQWFGVKQGSEKVVRS